MYFLVVLFVMPYKLVLAFESVLIKFSSATFKMKAVGQYFPVMFNMLCKAVKTFESLDKN